MTSTIYQKLKPKRKYRKTPPCGHTDGYCDMEHCRQQYHDKAPKEDLSKDQPRFEKNIAKLVKKGKNKPIKEEVFHKVKAGDRRREIELNKLDGENVTWDIQYSAPQILGEKDYLGEYGKRKREIKRYKRMFWRVVFILIGIVVAYPVVIAIMDLFY